MPNVNFGSFNPITPSGEDFLVGFRGTTETRTKVSALTSIEQPTIDKVSNLSIDGIRYQSTYTSVNSLSNRWSAPYTYVNSSSANLDSAVSVVQANSANWNAVYNSGSEVIQLRTDVNILSTRTNTISAQSDLTYRDYWLPTAKPSVREQAASSYTIIQSPTGRAAWDLTALTLLGNYNPSTGYPVYYEQPWSAWERTKNRMDHRLNGLSAVFTMLLGYTVDEYSIDDDDPLFTIARTNIRNTSAAGFKAHLWNYAYDRTAFYNENNVYKTGDTNPAGNNPLFKGAVTTVKTLTSQFIYGNEFVTKLYVDAVTLANSISGNFNPSLYYLASQLYTQTQVDDLISGLMTNYTLTSSNRWSSSWTTVQNNSAAWGGLDLTDAVEELQTNTFSLSVKSRAWDSTYNTVNPVSSTWNSTASTVQVNSPSWNDTTTTVRVNSANWNSTFNSAQQLQSDVNVISAGALYLESKVVEIAGNLTITNGNQSLFNGKILHVNSPGEITITFGLNLPENFSLSIVNLGNNDILLLPNDGSLLKAANYRIYGSQYATVTFYKYKNNIYALGTVPAV